MHMMQLNDDLYQNHWRHRYSWHGVSISKLAEHYHCSEDDVRTAMLEIQEEYPKPKKQWNEDTCDTCGAEIVWINKHPCNPKVIKGIDAVGKFVTVCESHFSSCPQAAEHRRRA